MKSEKSRIRLSSSDSFGQSWKSNLKPHPSLSANSQKSIRKVICILQRLDRHMPVYQNESSCNQIFKMTIHVQFVSS